jgi:hypothetical protein
VIAPVLEGDAGGRGDGDVQMLAEAIALEKHALDA